MAYTSEIDKLERRWKENPQGTVFAPLAEVYRKDGQLERAREVLRQGLVNNPDHIPGNIVLGRCCLDMGDDGGAEAAFSHVLELDPENVIALKALGEITERQGRLAEASQWLGRLMQVDPTNEDAREQLKRVESVQQQAALVMSAEPIAEMSPAEEPVLQNAALDEPVPEPIEPASAKTRELTPPEPPPAFAPSASSYQDDDTLVVETVPTPTFDAPAEYSPPESESSMPLESSHQSVPFEESDLLPSAEFGTTVPEPLPGIETVEFNARAAAETASLAPLTDLQRGDEFNPPADLGIEVLSHEEPAPIDLRAADNSEFQPADHSNELLDVRPSTASEFQVPDASSELALSAAPSNEFQPPSGTEDLLGASGGGGEYQNVSDPARDLAPEDSAAMEETVMLPPVDETPPVAEEEVVEGEVIDLSASAAAVEERSDKLPLIFPDDAGQEPPPRSRRISQPDETATEPEPIFTESMAEAYARQGLNDQALHVYRRLAEQMPGDHRMEAKIRELESLLGAGSEPATARWPAYSASVTGGESVESFFHSLAAARPAAIGGPAEPASRPSAEPQADDQSPGAPTRPANDALSLSAIFGEESTQPPPATPPAPPSASTPTTGHAFSFDQFFGGKDAPGSGSQSSGRTTPPSGLEEDLDQFQNWLKSLKK
ncbi:MAG TPA: tetratricopeptide repeat protein [Gemmatimonadales bacterium]|jgi:tetratricopeptide (TPR) repeat protein